MLHVIIRGLFHFVQVKSLVVDVRLSSKKEGSFNYSIHFGGIKLEAKIYGYVVREMCIKFRMVIHHPDAPCMDYLRQMATVKGKWMFPKIGELQNGWLKMENPFKMDDFGFFPIFLG